MAITTRFAGTACPVTKSGAQTILFAGGDLDWEWVSDANAAGNWYAYNVTRSAALALNGNITGTEFGGYTATVTGDASAWATGDLCFISNSATIATHATFAAAIAARGALDTILMGYASATYSTFFNGGATLATTPVHIYGHLSRQRCVNGISAIYADGDQSANTTQVTWRNFTAVTTATSYYRDTGAGKTGAGVKWRRIVAFALTTNPAFRALGGANNVCRFEFCVAVVCGITGTGFYTDVPGLVYHCVAIGGGVGFGGGNQTSTFQNCAAIFCTTGYGTKTNGTFTKCADTGATGSGDLDNQTWETLDLWGQGNNAGFFGIGGADCRILTSSALYNAGTAIGGLTTDIDGTAIAAGTCPVGIHSGTTTAYGAIFGDVSSESSLSESSLSESSGSESSPSTSSTTTSTSSSTLSSSSTPSSESSASESSLSESSASGGGNESSASESSASESTPSTSTSTTTSTSSTTSSTSSTTSSSSTSGGSSSSSSESGPGDFTVNEYEDFMRDEGDSVTIERKSLTVSETGARSPSWTTVDTVYASIQPASSEDRAPFERRGIFVSHKVFIAEDPGVTEGDRIGRSSTVKYLIHGVKDVMDRGELYVLYCEEMKVST